MSVIIQQILVLDVTKSLRVCCFELCCDGFHYHVHVVHVAVGVVRGSFRAIHTLDMEHLLYAQKES